MDLIQWWVIFLVGGLEHFLFSHKLGIIIPIDFHIFQMDWNHQPVFDIVVYIDTQWISTLRYLSIQWWLRARRRGELRGVSSSRVRPLGWDETKSRGVVEKPLEMVIWRWFDGDLTTRNGGLMNQWVDFSWENLNRKPGIFQWRSWDFPVIFPLKQSIQEGFKDETLGI